MGLTQIPDIWILTREGVFLETAKKMGVKKNFVSAKCSGAQTGNAGARFRKENLLRTRPRPVIGAKTRPTPAKNVTSAGIGIWCTSLVP